MLDVGHAAIVEFQSVPVKYFPQFAVRRKRSINEADERSSDVGFDVLVIRWVEPYNISWSLAFLCRWSLWWRLEF